MDFSLGSLGLRSAVPAGSCCSHLASALGPKVIFPSTAAYNATLAEYYSIQEASLSPSCFVAPETSQDVAEAVSTILALDNCNFAIKGRTHMPAGGAANINGGVTIDMSTLDSITVNKDHSMASVGAGASWLDVYTYLDTLSLTVAGGRNGAVGVGGSTLGGGISYFAPRVGWACDNVMNYEIVLASGKLTNANATSKPDLFRALKGGMNNFGVVTRFDLFTIPQGDIYIADIATADIDQRSAVFKAFSDIANAKSYDIYASLVLGLTYSFGTGWTTGTTAAYTKPIPNPNAPPKTPTTYKPLIAIPTTNTTERVIKLGILSNETALPPLNWNFHTGTYGVTPALLDDIFDTINATVHDFSVPGGVIWSIAFEPFPSVFASHATSRTPVGNSLGTTPAQGDAFILLITAIWPNSTQDAVVQSVATKVSNQVNAVAKKRGLLRDYEYVNYADLGTQADAIASYGPANVQALRAASRKYDPERVFQKRVPGGFKIPGL
ncbi:hypothetical protein MMC25_002742 [Agyrium rufum]|nr:hypothetical protein [Agyrium rufum]